MRGRRRAHPLTRLIVAPNVSRHHNHRRTAVGHFDAGIPPLDAADFEGERMTVRKSEKTGWCKRSSSTRSGRARLEESMARALVPVLVPGTYVLIASNALLSLTPSQWRCNRRGSTVTNSSSRGCTVSVSVMLSRLTKLVPLTFAARHSREAGRALARLPGDHRARRETRS